MPRIHLHRSLVEARIIFLDKEAVNALFLRANVAFRIAGGPADLLTGDKDW